MPTAGKHGAGSAGGSQRLEASSGEAAEISEFGHQDHRGELIPRIAWWALTTGGNLDQSCLEPLQLLSRIVGRVQSLLQDDIVRGMSK
jgi:hypothetical protein